MREQDSFRKRNLLTKIENLIAKREAEKDNPHAFHLKDANRNATSNSRAIGFEPPALPVLGSANTGCSSSDDDQVNSWAKVWTNGT